MTTISAIRVGCDRCKCSISSWLLCRSDSRHRWFSRFLSVRGPLLRFLSGCGLVAASTYQSVSARRFLISKPGICSARGFLSLDISIWAYMDGEMILIVLAQIRRSLHMPMPLTCRMGVDKRGGLLDLRNLDSRYIHRTFAARSGPRLGLYIFVRSPVMTLQESVVVSGAVRNATRDCSTQIESYMCC